MQLLDGDGGLTETMYFRDGQVESVKDPPGYTTEHVYDKAKRPIVNI